MCSISSQKSAVERLQTKNFQEYSLYTYIYIKNTDIKRCLIKEMQHHVCTLCTGHLHEQQEIFKSFYFM